ncbi:TPA: carbon-nitrogen hydrolase family protein [Vibrio vulnificus]|nr:carbon-nitrogen hydrolase family protein [Vibrio vulnificus]HDY8235327.1 carbon-nitrogen hydrolase family protein [Vibrio vulnificus]
MNWSIDENISMIRTKILDSVLMGADMVFFPELSLTGFHKNIPNYQNFDYSDYISDIKRISSDKNIIVGIGLPILNDGKVYNSYLIIDGDNVYRWDKIGLTDSEYKYFTSGKNKPIVTLRGIDTSVVFCREVDDYEDLFLVDNVDLILWPSYIGTSDRENTTGYTNQYNISKNSLKVAEMYSSTLIQSNWSNALNNPNINMSGSKIIMDKIGIIFQAAEGQDTLLKLQLNSKLYP